MVSIVYVCSSTPAAGKTTVAAALIRQLTRLGARPVGIKPIELGVGYDEHQDLLGPDGDRLAAASTVQVPPLVRSPYRFTSRTTPLVAAERAGITLGLDDLVSAIETAKEYGGPVVVEGPGAAWSALADDTVGLDLAERLGATILLVVPERPGEEAAALGTLEGCRKRGLRIAGICRTQAGTPWTSAERSCFFSFAGARDLGATPLPVEDEAADQALAGLGTAVADALAWP